MALGGGIKEGSWVILTGDPKCGKTTTALQIAANCQKEGRPIIYLDAEGRLKEMNLLGVDGLDKEKMQIIHSEDEPLSAEAFLDIAVKLVSAKENEGCVCIIDSTGQIVPNQRATLIIITHFIANTSGYGASRMPDCGRKIQYQADTRMEVKSISPWVQSDRQVGQAVNWKVVCSSMGSPGTECQSWIKYGHGVDKIQELIMLGLDLGLIGKAGAWFTCEFMVGFTDVVKKIKPETNIEDTEAVLKAVKFQGQERLYNFLLANEEVFDILEKEIKGML